MSDKDLLAEMQAYQNLTAEAHARARDLFIKTNGDIDKNGFLITHIENTELFHEINRLLQSPSFRLSLERIS